MNRHNLHSVERALMGVGKKDDWCLVLWLFLYQVDLPKEAFE